MSKIVLYDLPSEGRCACWSLNTWKTRLALNYKGLDYTTTWVEAPEVAPTLKALSLEPNPKGTPYTVPTVQFPDGTPLMDSRKIATELEQRYPSPSLRLDSPVLKEVEELVGKIMPFLWLTVVFPKAKSTIPPRSAEHFERAFIEQGGKSVSQLVEGIGEDARTKAEPAMKELGHLLKAEGGPFLLGKTASYADFVIVSFLQCIKRCDEDLYERAVAIEPALKILYDASTAWLERDDY